GSLATSESNAPNPADGDRLAYIAGSTNNPIVITHRNGNGAATPNACRANDGIIAYTEAGAKSLDWSADGHNILDVEGGNTAANGKSASKGIWYYSDQLSCTPGKAF